MDKQTEELAKKTGIKTRLEKIEMELLEISGVAGIRFDIRDYEEIHYIIFLALYNIPVSAPNYYKLLGEMKIKVVETAPNTIL